MDLVELAGAQTRLLEGGKRGKKATKKKTRQSETQRIVARVTRVVERDQVQGVHGRG
jgi:hypothetical protein